MNYERIYNQIIQRAKAVNRKKVKGGIYYEAHHIIPRCMGGEGYTKDINHPNIVLLTAKEHYMAHRLLCEIYPDNRSLKYAIWMMINGSSKYERYIPSSRIYAQLREYNATIPISDEIKVKIIAARKGKTYKEIYGDNADAEKLKRSNKYTTEETRRKQSIAAKGKTSHFKGKTYKEIYGDDWENQKKKRVYVHSEEAKLQISLSKKKIIIK